MPPAPHPLQVFAKEVKAVTSTGQATPEVSHYPALGALLGPLCRSLPVPLQALPQASMPGSSESGHPDFGLIEAKSLVMACPIEVKGVGADLGKLAATEQTRKYALGFGGGLCLVTNLWQWGLARYDEHTDAMVEDASMRVNLAASAAEFLAGNLADTTDSMRHLTYLISTSTRERGNITSPQRVAKLLAYHATNMRDAVNKADKKPDELFASLRRALADGLQIDLTGGHLTPTVVQTLVYGAFAAWLEAEDPTKFQWMQSSFKTTVPVFAEILHEALRPSLLRHCDLISHLDDVERVLRWTNRDAFSKAFDGQAIQYFYEPFLAEFDPVLRADLGIWYTPKEVADYQVARVHHHLVNDLGIADGLADASVYLLDPATGTGTYLISACEFIYAYHLANNEPPAVAAARTRDAMTRRLVGFEILPAAFIICHLHISRYLAQLGAPVEDRRVRVYLTNSLTGWRPEDATTGHTLFPELEEELADAGIAKQSDPVIAVVGNPPYEGYSSAETEEEKAMMAAWSTASTTTWKLRKLRLNDLYVRFWRVAIHRITHLSQRGVISFITNRKWLGGRSYPAMRQALVDEFTSIWVDDLHGGTHDTSHAQDQSIFTTNFAAGIQVGTAIVTAVRDIPVGSPAQIHLADYRGLANTKRAELTARSSDFEAASYEQVTCTAKSRFKFAADSAGDYPSLTEYLPVYFSGVQPIRDEAVVDFAAEALTKRMRRYFDEDLTWEQLAAAEPAFAVKRARYDGAKVRQSLLRQGAQFEKGRVVRYTFRPMDERWLYWETRAKLLNEARAPMYPYWASVESQVTLVASITPRRPTGIRPFPARAVAGFSTVDPDARIMPLYGPNTLAEDSPGIDRLFETSAASATGTMVAPEWVAAARSVLGGTPQEAGESLFYALVAVTHSPAWLADQPVESDDFATVPLPADPDVLADAATLGRTITDLFDTSTQVTGVTTGRIETHLGNLAVPTDVHGTVDLDGAFGSRGGSFDGTGVAWSSHGRWDSVPLDVWEFTVGGFQVLPKWLSYRVGTGLSAHDREAFRQLVRRIAQLRHLESDADAIFQVAKDDMLTV